MIALITGQLAYKSIDHIIVDVGGIGYRLLIPLSSYYRLPEQGNVRLHVYTHVREDAIQLYGFLAPEEREFFLLLISVSGIGPKLALNILSHSSVEALRQALARGDAKGLSALPGIGKKTAERLILELRDKLPPLAPGAPAQRPAPAPGATRDPFDDALSALLNLGYKEAQARKALESVEAGVGASLEDILRGALKILMR